MKFAVRNSLNFLNNIIFKKLHGNNIIYNQCWEDVALDITALELQKTDAMMVLTSAGCNILAYLLHDVNKIHALDINPHQNALLELKIAMIEYLDYETFFQFFGKGRIHEPEKIYSKTIRSALSSTAQTYWDWHIHLFDKKRKVGFYFSTATGSYARFFNFICRRVLGLDDDINKLVNAPSLEEQTKIYHRLEPRIFTNYWKFFWTMPILLNLVGTPLPQLSLVNQQYPGGTKQFLQDVFRYVMTNTHLQSDNYFWYVYLQGEYNQTSCPAYLKEDSFHSLKKMDLRKKVQIHHQSVLNFAISHTAQINKFVLLDHMDWLSQPKHRLLLQKQWEGLLKIAAPNAKIIFRSAGLNINWMKDIKVHHHNKMKPLFDCLHFDTETAAKLHARDRVHSYGSFYIANVI